MIIIYLMFNVSYDNLENVKFDVKQKRMDDISVTLEVTLVIFVDSLKIKP